MVLDKKHSLKKGRIENQGIPAQNIIVWTKNGIENLYPRDVMADAFRCDPQELDGLNFEADPIEYNGMRKTKKELALFVADHIKASHALTGELENLITQIRDACG